LTTFHSGAIFILRGDTIPETSIQHKSVWMDMEESARKNIDGQLTACGWQVQEHARMNLRAGCGGAVPQAAFEGML